MWTAAPAPIRHEGARYTCAHGMGYSRFEHVSHGIALELTLLVPLEDPIKICRLRMRNDSPRRRSISVTAYVEWVLGPSRTAARRTSSPSWMTAGALFARNPWNQPFPGVAFADLRGAQTELTCDRDEFLGSARNARRAGGAGDRRAALGTRRRGARSLRSAARAHRARAFVEPPKSCSCWARRRMTTQRAPC